MTEEIFCSKCGHLFKDEGEATYVGADTLCKSCLDSYCVYCEDCGEWVYEENAKYIYMDRGRSKWVCLDCLEDGEYFYCDDCERWYSENMSTPVETHDGRYICESCYEDDYFTCHGCGEVYRWGEGEEGADEERYCVNCYGRVNAINGYYYKPYPKCKSTHDQYITPENAKELLLGAELEIDKGENPYDTAKQIAEASEDVYIKHDGSLGSKGMEIVTHPCTLEYHEQELGWENIIKVAKDNDYVSHDARSCGLHIHVGKMQLGETHQERVETIAKIVLLVDRHWEFMRKFSRRRERQLNEWAKAPNLNIKTNAYTKEQVIDKALNIREYGRYQAVNLTNEKTVEFRLFNGTLRKETLYATLELVSNICKMAKKWSVEQVLHSSWSDMENIEHHDNLSMYIKERHINDTENPKAVYLLEKELKADDNELKVGDIVKVINADGWGHGALERGIGEVGRVMEIRDERNNNITVQFSNRFSYDLWSSSEYGAYCYNVDRGNIRTLFNN